MPEGRAAGVDDPTALLLGHTLFGRLEPEELTALTRRLGRVSFDGGAVFVREGEPGDCLYVLLAGRAEVVKALATNEERSFGELAAGDILGELSLLEPGSPRSASVRARTPVEALVMTAADF